MRFAPREWLRFFFARPLRLADISALWRRLSGKERRVRGKRRKKSVRMKPGTDRRMQADRRRAILAELDANDLSRDDPTHGIDITEQPLDTLPADLQDELLRPDPRKTPKPPPR